MNALLCALFGHAWVFTDRTGYNTTVRCSRCGRRPVWRAA